MRAPPASRHADFRHPRASKTTKVSSALQRDGFAFLPLADGSLLGLIAPPDSTRSAVVLLGSEGEARTVASSLEESLVALSKGATGIDDLDDGDADGHEKGMKALKR